MPSVRSQPSLDETQAVARELFAQLTVEQFHEEGFRQEEEQRLMDEFHQFGALNGYSNPMMASIGRDLRKISEQFANSSQRENVRKKAEKIDIESMSYEHFSCLLNELFQNGGITRESIVVLFFFCTDVAIRAFSNGTGTFRRLLRWTFDFIFNYVCQWVQRQGGWEVVLRDYVSHVAITVCCVMASVAFFIYIKRNWNSLS